jgi:lipoic acid synthetase
MSECFSDGFTTFMILGRVCTRGCAFCSAQIGVPHTVDRDEPSRVAACAARLALRHVIVTSVTRDDIEDGGASHFVDTARSVRRALPHAVIELLVPDFSGDRSSIAAIAASGADIIGHNIETTERLYASVRPGADYRRSLGLLSSVKALAPSVKTKSAILAGIGEAEGEIAVTMEDLRAAGCDILAIGQYLRPHSGSIAVDRYVAPEEFENLKALGMAMGFENVSSGPFVRSSYRPYRSGG